MYQALYRKYRPSNFDEVVGQLVILLPTNDIASVEIAINNVFFMCFPPLIKKDCIARCNSKE